MASYAGRYTRSAEFGALRNNELTDLDRQFAHLMHRFGVGVVSLNRPKGMHWEIDDADKFIAACTADAPPTRVLGDNINIFWDHINQIVKQHKVATLHVECLHAEKPRG